MKKHVILLAESPDELVSDLLEILDAAGIVVSKFQLSEARVIQPQTDVGQVAHNTPIAVVCELTKSAAASKLRPLVEQAHSTWPGLPVVACEHATNPIGLKTKKQLMKAGFRAVAESPAQLPALLREVEENPAADEVPKPFKSMPAGNAFALPGSTRNQKLRDAFSLIASLHFAGSQKEAAAVAVAGLAELTDADRWSIFASDQHTSRDEIELELLATETPGTAGASQTYRQPVSDSDAVSPWAATSVAHEAVFKGEPVRKTRRENRIVALPLVCRERIHGVLEGIRRRPGSRSFSRSDIAFLNAISTSIAAALSNSLRVAEAERLSVTDELTRLHNARYLRQFLVNEMKRARRFGSKISALFLDLDDFKTVNDQHGHLAGSHVLMEVASVILPSVRDTDCVVRYGGDEFVIILPETGVNEAVMVADRIRAKLERHRFTGGRRQHISLTSSIGLAVFPDNALSPHQLIACADRAMYAAKAANKNCVRVMTSLELPPTEARPAGEPVDGPQFQRIPREKFIS